jgi:hypothetical protein
MIVKHNQSRRDKRRARNNVAAAAASAADAAEAEEESRGDGAAGWPGLVFACSSGDVSLLVGSGDLVAHGSDDEGVA